MNTQLQTLKGFRDFLPEEKCARDFVARTIKTVFETSGFAPIETPTLEYASLLLGKYGDEADKLVYTFADKGDRQVGLRYDQTVPTARVLAQYANQLPKFFRRYQMQNVFRADKPQKGRFREFTQCDCDIFGTTSPIADAELLAVFYQVYAQLGLADINIYCNDRATLIASLSPFATEQVRVFSIIQSIDKLDKISERDVIAELINKGLVPSAAQEALTTLQSTTMSENLQQIFANAYALGVPEGALVFLPFLARGLDYYTGLIFEGKIAGYEVGAVGGGGRYDNLIGELSGNPIPAAGFAVGFDRTVEAVQTLNSIKLPTSAPTALVTSFSEATLNQSLQAAAALRAAGIRVEVYPQIDQIGKQIKLANQKQIPWVVIVGESEAAENQVTLKELATGTQQTLSIEAAIQLLTE